MPVTYDPYQANLMADGDRPPSGTPSTSVHSSPAHQQGKAQRQLGVFARLEMPILEVAWEYGDIYFGEIKKDKELIMNIL